jgi:NADPH:quinone reductase-like Zn-dependent oxidoreductase
MRAIVVRDYAGPEAIKLETVPVPRPAPDEILVQVRAVTVNRTRDLNVCLGKVVGAEALPLVPGQDPAGLVAGVGADVTGLNVGDAVIVNSRMPCGRCSHCVDGRTSECRAFQHIGIHRWGGYAEFVAVPARQAQQLPPGLDFAHAAVAMRHFPMAFQQIDRKAEVKPGQWVLVMGASGGLGTACVQVAKYRGAHVIAGAGADERVAAAIALGADHGVNYRREDLVARVKAITGGRGVDVVCENISDPTTWPAAFQCLAPHGRLVTSGAHGGGVVPVDMKHLYHNRLSILGVAGSDERDNANAMAAAGSGAIKGVVERIMRLDALLDAFELIISRKVTGKIVIDPSLP